MMYYQALLGKVVSATDTSAQTIPNTEETYIPAEDGYDLTLTIDLNIQMIVEKYLEQAVENNYCEGGRKCNCYGPKYWRYSCHGKLS